MNRRDLLKRGIRLAAAAPVVALLGPSAFAVPPKPKPGLTLYADDRSWNSNEWLGAVIMCDGKPMTVVSNRSYTIPTDGVAPRWLHPQHHLAAGAAAGYSTL